MNAETTLTLTECADRPLYVQLHDRLLEQIKLGVYKEGEALPGIKHLAAASGVSVITVEAALKRLIASGICYRRPKKGTFVVPRSTRPGVRAAGGNVRQAMVVYSPCAVDADRMLAEFNYGIHAQAREAGVDLLHISGDLNDNLASLTDNPGLEVRGVMILYAAHLEAVAQVAARHPDMRFVLLNYQFEGFSGTPDNLYGVFSDEFGGGYAMTDYLLKRGCRKIAVLSSQSAGNCNYPMRIAGYRMALENFGLRYDPKLVADVHNEGLSHLRQAGREGVIQILGYDLPDAIFGLNDLLTAGAIEYLRQERPELNIAMAGFDHYDPEVSMSYNFPTMAVDTEGLGRMAVRILCSEEMPVKSFRLAATLIQR